MAYQLLEDDLCPSCSVPVWLGHSTLGEIEFKVHHTTCYGCAEKAAYAKLHEKQADPGGSEWVEVVIPDGVPWPTRAQGFATFEDTAGHVSSEQNDDESYEENTFEDAGG